MVILASVNPEKPGGKLAADCRILDLCAFFLFLIIGLSFLQTSLACSFLFLCMVIEKDIDCSMQLNC